MLKCQKVQCHMRATKIIAVVGKFNRRGKAIAQTAVRHTPIDCGGFGCHESVSKEVCGSRSLPRLY